MRLILISFLALFLIQCGKVTGGSAASSTSTNYDTTSIKLKFDSPCAPPTSAIKASATIVEIGKIGAVPTVFQVKSFADDGPGSLRAAVAAAKAGDTLYFDPSLAKDTIHLVKELVLSKSIILDATTAVGLTLDGGNAVRILSVNSNVSLTVTGITFINGRAVKVGNGGDETGGAISTGNACMLKISQCHFNHNVADCGGAVRAGYGTFTTIEDCSFLANDGSGANNGFSAGGISTNGHGELIVRRCDFVQNKGNSGAAIYNLLQPITIEDCSIVGNISNNDGAAIFTDEGNWVGPGATKGGHILVRRCWMEANQSKAFGGACMLWANPLDTVQIENSVFKNNAVAKGGKWGDSKGGAIRGNGILTIRNCAFVNNKAEAQGGALWLDGNGPVNIVNTLFTENTVTDDQGGAITFNTGGIVNVINCTIAKNHAGRACGGFWFGNPDLPITISNSIVAFNTAGQDHGQDQVGYQPKDGGGNLEFPAPVGNGKKVAAGSLVQDPLLDSLSQINGMLVLPIKTGSPAISLANKTRAPADDQTLKLRDANPDAGAWEFTSNVTTGIHCPQ